MVKNGRKWPRKLMRVCKSLWKLMIAVKQSKLSSNGEWCSSSKKPKDSFRKRGDDAWSFSSSWHTFGASQYARIFSTGFWQNTGKQGKTCHFVVQEAWQMWKSPKWPTKTVPSKGSPWNLGEWCMNISWRRSDAPNGLRLCRNDAFDASSDSRHGGAPWWGTKRKTTHSEGYLSWHTVSDSPRLTVSQLMHSWCNDCSKTCLNDWICPQIQWELSKLTFDVQTSMTTVQWMVWDAKGRPMMHLGIWLAHVEPQNCHRKGGGLLGPTKTWHWTGKKEFCWV